MSCMSSAYLVVTTLIVNPFNPKLLKWTPPSLIFLETSINMNGMSSENQK